MSHPDTALVSRRLADALDPVRIFERTGLVPDEWQADVLRSSAQQMLLLCGRQTGKSTVVGVMVLHEAVYHAPALILLLAPAERQAKELFLKTLVALRKLGASDPVKLDAESALQATFRNGSRIIALPSKEGTIRGFSGVRLLVIDEAAHVPDELYFAVRPMLAVSRGRLVCLSTPFGKRGFFYEAWERGGDAWKRVRITSDKCPRITPEFLAEERAAAGDWWYRQEYLCEFVETDDQVFATDLVEAALTREVRPLFEDATVADAEPAPKNVPAEMVSSAVPLFGSGE